MAVKERLEAAKSGSTRGLGPNSPSAAGSGPFASGNTNPFNRIAKPLRGGGGGGDAGGGSAMVPTFAGLQAQEGTSGAGGKRGSWFFNQRT